MPVIIGAKPQSPFEDPLGLLTDCHRRIESFLGVLIKVTERYAGGPLDAEAVSALRTALDYFREAAPKHTQDEEDSLFPRMRSAQGDSEILHQVEALETDHRLADAGHAEVDRLGRLWLQESRLSESDVQVMSDTLQSLRSVYEKHIALEDDVIFPAAARMLVQEELKDVGREMANRRGVQNQPPAPMDSREGYCDG